jgi:IgGFc binding protein
MTMLSDGRVFRVFRISSVIACATIPVLLVAACSTGRDEFDDPIEVVVPPDAAMPDAPGCGYRCSPDLKKVLEVCDGRETVVAECGPDQGCGGDKCIDACASAELSKGSTGCWFWTVPPDDTFYSRGACFAAMVTNTWDRPVTLRADYGSEPLDISQSVYTATLSGDSPVYTRLTGPLPPGEVGIVFLSQAEILSEPDPTPCPRGVTPALRADPIRHGTSITRAFSIKTDAPVSAYSIFPYGGAESYVPTATLLLPVSSWDKSYFAVSAGRYGDETGAIRRTLQIVASEDDTQVFMRPNRVIYAGQGVDAGGEGEVQKWTLSRGQVLQINQRPELTGSPIESTKPIAVFGGAECSKIPQDYMACDLMQQQIPPFVQWGREYALVPYLSRIQDVTGTARETVPWMFVGAVDGTVLSYEPERPPGAPYELAAGRVVYFMTDAITVVRSQDTKHPFYAAVHMSSSTYSGEVPGSGGPGPGGGWKTGDPEFVNVVPTDQFLDRYVFFADYTYRDTSLTFVRRRTPNGFMPVELDCAGEITGFKPLGSSGEYEYAWVELTKGYSPQKYPRGECTTGRHEARSAGTFSVTVWGADLAASYGYAGGMGSRPINGAPPIPVK